MGRITYISVKLPLKKSDFVNRIIFTNMIEVLLPVMAK